MTDKKQIPLFKVLMSEKVDEPLLEVLHSGWIGEGDKVKEFEEKIGNRINNPLCLALSSGTHGLTLALRLIDMQRHTLGKVGPGSVITSSMTCFATNAPVLNNDAEIIWADVKKDMNIDPESVREKIREDTKAILFVHWGGYPADLEKLKKISDEYDIPLIEDAAHSFGSKYKGHPIGDCTYTKYGIFSWQAIKNLNAGEGGMFFTRSELDYQEAKLLRWFGISREGPRRDLRCQEKIYEAGFKYHMNDINATIGLENLKIFDNNLRKTQGNARFYNKELGNVPGLEIVQPETKEKETSSWLYTIHVEDRTGFARKMGENGIAVSQVHSRNDLQPCTEKFKSHLPMLDKIDPLYCCIPVGWWVSKEEREYIVDCIRKGW